MIQVVIPQLSLSMEEGKIIRWLVSEGAGVSSGQAILEVETDKATVEVEAPANGTIRLLAEEGAVLAVNTPIAEIDEAGASQTTKEAGAPTSPASTAPKSDVQDDAKDPTPSPAGSTRESTPDRRNLASPAVRRIARDRGIDLTKVQGSGPGGRVMARDLEALPTTPSLRDLVVAQLVASWREIPHIHIGGELDGSGLAAAKRTSPAGVTVTDLLITAVVHALRDVPELNGTVGKPSDRIHLALAVATPGGVISPVIRNADKLSLTEIAGERARLVKAARAGTSDRRDLAGGTITLTNLGAYPVDFFAPVVSGPQVAMLATGRLVERPVAINGAVSVRHRIWMNVAIDHRAGDGVAGARFLAALERCMNELSPT